MMWAAFILVGFRVSFVKSCAKNDLSNSLSQSFFWQNGIPMHIDVHNQVCDLLLSKLDTLDASKSQHNVLSFGDSYEMALCMARPSGGIIRSPFSYVKEIESKNIYVECTYRSESISYKVRRMFGQRGDAADTNWEHSNNNSITIFKEMGVHAENGVLSVEHPVGKSVVDAVVHGSFLWDLKHAHADWCRAQHDKLMSRTAPLTAQPSPTNTDFNHLIFESVCNHVQLRPSAASVNATKTNSSQHDIPARPMDAAYTELLLQSWERLTMPWCDAAMLRQWQETYLREVHALLDAFPDAALFLRTQPISSAVFLGNFRCHKPMNDFIVHVARSFQQSENDSKGGVGNSNINSNNSSNSISSGNNSTGNSGSVISSNSSESDKIVQKKRDRVVRLIDLYSLFATPNDNGVDHFSPDNAHLTEAGFKVYRAVILRVLADYFRNN